jgi:hypothetical protein
MLNHIVSSSCIIAVLILTWEQHRNALDAAHSGLPYDKPTGCPIGSAVSARAKC